MTAVGVTDIMTIRPIGHREAMGLQAVELERSLAFLRSLESRDWSMPTDCPDWDVRRMWLHVLGACEAGASIRESIHQMRRGRKRSAELGLPLEAGLSATQVAEREHLSPPDLLGRLERIAPKTVKARTRMPRPVRAAKIKVDGPVVERWSIGYLTDIIYLRDIWMHRVDTARAVGREVPCIPDHDGRIVADVVAEWARRHGQPFTLELSGPAGGAYTAGAGGEPLVLDAVEFCRILAGRGRQAGLLATLVPF